MKKFHTHKLFVSIRTVVKQLIPVHFFPIYSEFMPRVSKNGRIKIYAPICHYVWKPRIHSRVMKDNLVCFNTNYELNQMDEHIENHSQSSSHRDQNLTKKSD